MDTSTALGLTASAIHLTSYGLYNRQVFLGQSKPNTATWLLWAFLATLNSTSYLAMSHDWIKSATPIAGALACIFTLGFSFCRGKLSRLNRFDWTVLVIGVVAGLTWWWTRNAGWANMLLQAAFVLSNFPTYRGVWRDPSTEKPLPWFGFATAYALNTATVIVRWTGQWLDLGYPVISMVVDGGVGAAVLLRRRMVKRSGEVLKRARLSGPAKDDVV